MPLAKQQFFSLRNCAADKLRRLVDLNIEDLEKLSGGISAS